MFRSPARIYEIENNSRNRIEKEFSRSLGDILNAEKLYKPTPFMPDAEIEEIRKFREKRRWDNQFKRWKEVYLPQKKGRSSIEENEGNVFDEIKSGFEDKNSGKEAYKRPKRYDFDELPETGANSTNINEISIPQRYRFSELEDSEKPERDLIENQALQPHRNKERFGNILDIQGPLRHQQAVNLDLMENSIRAPNVSENLLDALENGKYKKIPVRPREDVPGSPRGFSHRSGEIQTDFEYDPHGHPIRERSSQYQVFRDPSDGKLRLTNAFPTTAAIHHEKSHAASQGLDQNEYDKRVAAKNSQWLDDEEKHNITNANLNKKPYHENEFRQESGLPSRVNYDKDYPVPLDRRNMARLANLRHQLGEDIDVDSKLLGSGIHPLAPYGQDLDRWKRSAGGNIQQMTYEPPSNNRPFSYQDPLNKSQWSRSYSGDVKETGWFKPSR